MKQVTILHEAYQEDKVFHISKFRLQYFQYVNT